MSAVDVQIDTDWYYNLSDWSVVGDSTGLIAGDMTGGAGSMSFSLPEGTKSRYLSSRPCLLKDPHMGTTSGNLRLSSGNSVNATITGYSKIAALNVTRTAEAYDGTVRGAILYYMGLAGVTTNIAIENAIAIRSARYIGWVGNVLDHIKDLCVAQGMELSLIGQTYAFRIAGKRLVTTRSFADYTWSASEDQLAQNVEVAWYNTSAPSAQLVYPAGGWHDTIPVFEVDAGAVAVYEVDLGPDPDDESSVGISALTIQQPAAVDSVNRTYAGPDSVYSVAGKDGLPIPAAQWRAGGGGIRVALSEGGAKLTVTITGSSEEEYAPYQIAMSSGTSDSYSSLRVYGTGMRYRRGVLKMATGLDEDRAPQESAPIADSPFLNNYEAAWRAGTGLLSRHSGATFSIQGTLADIDTYRADTTIYFGSEALEDDPAVQAYGNLEGSMFIADGKVFRIRSVTYTPSGGTFTAEQHVTGSAHTEMLKLAEGVTTRTANQWNAYHETGLIADELTADPMRGYTL